MYFGESYILVFDCCYIDIRGVNVESCLLGVYGVWVLMLVV